jgi:hypothetical protein
VVRHFSIALGQASESPCGRTASSHAWGFLCALCVCRWCAAACAVATVYRRLTDSAPAGSLIVHQLRARCYPEGSPPSTLPRIWGQLHQLLPKVFPFQHRRQCHWKPFNSMRHGLRVPETVVMTTPIQSTNIYAKARSRTVPAVPASKLGSPRILRGTMATNATLIPILPWLPRGNRQGYHRYQRAPMVKDQLETGLIYPACIFV